MHLNAAKRRRARALLRQAEGHAALTRTTARLAMLATRLAAQELERIHDEFAGLAAAAAAQQAQLDQTLATIRELIDPPPLDLEPSDE